MSKFFVSSNRPPYVVLLGAALLGAALLVVSSAAAQPRVAYEIAFPNAVHHEAEVTATFEGVPAGVPLSVRMSRTSPGRYALHEFAKNVYGVEAFDGQGRPLDVQPVGLHRWDVAGHDGTVRFAYTLFGDRADGTYTGINARYAHLNIPATFVWARGFEAAPVRVTFRRPDPDWSVATQLFPTDHPETFSAPDFYYFMDSPTHLGEIDWRTWEVTSEGKTYTIRLAVDAGAVDAGAGDAVLDAYADHARRIVAEQVAVFGETPDFEPGTYTFIATYRPTASGDGMEHRNSTILTAPLPLDAAMTLLLGTLSHEFFHAWNVERLRPQALQPFDFEDANVTGELWFAEGFTSYYDDLFLRRAGVIDDAGYARALTRTVDAIVNAPGRRFYSPVEMSRQAPFVDAAASIDPQNKANTFLSYYTWGAGIGLGLDLTLRTRYGVSLDDYMRVLWERYGEPEVPYTHADLEQVLADVTGDPAFAGTFFARYVEGREVVDYEALLAAAGYLLRPAAPGRAWLGAPLVDAVDDVAGRVVVAEGTLAGSPLYTAGVDRGDVLLRLDGQDVATAADVAAVLERHAPGDALRLTFERDGVPVEATLALTQDPALEVVPYEAAGLAVTDAIRAVRAAWLSGRSKVEGRRLKDEGEGPGRPRRK